MSSSTQAGGETVCSASANHRQHRDELLASQVGAEPSELIVLTPYPVEPGHTLLSIVRLGAADWKPEMRSNATLIAEGVNKGIVIMKAASIMDYNRTQSGQKERQQPPSAKMSFKVFLINSETGKLTLEQRTLRFWLHQPLIILNNNNNNNNSGQQFGNNDDNYKSTRTFANIKQESSQLAQACFRQLIGSKPNDDFPKKYTDFIMKLMRLLKTSQFKRIVKMEIELRHLAHDDHAKPPSRACKFFAQHLQWAICVYFDAKESDRAQSVWPADWCSVSSRRSCCSLATRSTWRLAGQQSI